MAKINTEPFVRHTDRRQTQLQVCSLLQRRCVKYCMSHVLASVNTMAISTCHFSFQKLLAQPLQLDCLHRVANMSEVFLESYVA